MARISCEGNECDQVKDRFAAAITTGDYISNILRVAKGFGGQLCQEDGKLGIWRHFLHVNNHGVKVVGLRIALDDRDKASRIWEQRFDTGRYQRELDNQGRVSRSQHFDRWSDLS